MDEEKAKRKIWNREHYQRNRLERDTYHLEWVRKKRLEIINKLGGRCNLCGERDPIVLDFDHINDDGAIDKKLNKRNLQSIDKRLERYQVLCKNCNWRKEYWRRQHAKFKRKAASLHASRSSQSGVRKEGRRPAKRGKALLGSGQSS